MKYLYTTEPDEHCHEVEPGIWGRPVHTSYQADLKEQGWTSNIKDLKGDDHVREEKEGRKEEGEVGKHFEFTVDDNLEDAKTWVEKSQSDDREAWAELYEEKFGKKPHHKMKVENIRQKVEESDD